MFSYVNEEPGLGPDPLCEELISVGGRWGGGAADSFRSLFCRGVALEWIIMYISGIIVFFIKILLSCPVTNMEDILDQIKHFTITKLSFLNVPGQII